MIGRRLDHYEILAKLGEGGMGVVYKARDTHLDRLAAIKVLPANWVADPERKQRFVQEAKAASALNHPGIITIYDITHADGIDFIAMEYVQGHTLAELVGRKGLSLSDTLTYAIQAANALAKAHATGIVHRDLKPSNIMVTDDGLVKILDFGVAKLTTAAASDGDREAETQTMPVNDRLQTAAGTTVGTMAYMSPEQAEGRKVDGRSDIFSFGAVLYEMVTGTRAFQGTSPALTLAAVVSGEPPPPSQVAKQVPAELDRIVLRCLRKDPARRFQIMADLAVELDEVKTDSGLKVPAARVPAHRSRWIWPAAAAVVLAAAGAGVWFMWPQSSSSLPPGTVGPLTTLAGDERSPALSPDGNQVAFSWNGESGNNTDVYVMPVGTGTPLRLTRDSALDTEPSWSPDGKYLAFVRSQGPEAAVYITTPPVPDAERKVADVRSVPNTPGSVVTIAWLPDGSGLITIDSDAASQMNGIVMHPVGPGEPRRLVWTPVSDGAYGSPALSPAGEVLGFAFCRFPWSCEIHVVELTRDLAFRNPPRALAAQTSLVTGLAWATDGLSLVYSLGSVATSFLWRVPVAGGEPERLELAGDHAASPSISSQGNRLAFTRRGNDADIWKLEPNRPPENFLSSTLDERNAQFSPDGRRVAFESRRLGFDFQIWVANADGTNPAPLTNGAQGIGGTPRWSPDSRSVVFDGQEPDGRRGVYVVDAKGGQSRLLATPGALPSWSHDGRWVYFHSNRTGRNEIWRVPAAGGEPVQVAHNGGGNPLASPDGTTLYYTRIGGPGELFAQPVAGGPERLVLNSMEPGINQYFPVNHGVYYAARPDQGTPLVRDVKFLDFATGRHETLRSLEARLATGLGVSPDGKTILYSGTRPSAGDDLMLIRNFR